MTFYPNEKLGLFVDGANSYSAARALDFDIDYRRLLDEFRKRGRLVRANYYTTLIEGEEYTPIRPLIDWLDYNGFRVITKAAREFVDDSGRRRIKGDMDVDLAIDIMEAADYLDHIVLFSGDGDFHKVVEAIQRKGVRVSVVSTLKSSPPMIADSLRRQADNFVELKDLGKLVGRERRQRDYEDHDQGGSNA